MSTLIKEDNYSEYSNDVENNIDTDINENEEEFSGYERADSDSGIITNKAEITQQQSIHITDVIFNGLLGEYADDGKYYLSDEIMRELADMPKHFIRKDKNGTYVDAKVNNKVFHFCITPRMDNKEKDGMAYCYLQLLEEISYTNGYVINTQTTTIATYEYKINKAFDEYMMIAFNVDQDNGGDDEGGRKYFNYDNIMLRLSVLDTMSDLSAGLFERLDEIYFNKRLQILNELPEATIILAEFNKEKAKVDKFFINNSKRRYRALNDLLNNVLDGPKGEKIKGNAAFNKKMQDLNSSYLKKVEEINEAAANSPQVKQIEEKEAVVPAINTLKEKPNVTLGDKKKPAPKNKQNFNKAKSSGKKSSNKSEKKAKKDNKKAKKESKEEYDFDDEENVEDKQEEVYQDLPDYIGNNDGKNKKPAVSESELKDLIDELGESNENIVVQDDTNTLGDESNVFV